MNTNTENFDPASGGHPVVPTPAHPVRSLHTFHIPVMGTGFTIDTPVRVGRYGISSVVSIGDDLLIESMRRHLCREFGREYIAIVDNEREARSRRITEYLNLLDSLLEQQCADMRLAAFEPGSDICRYFDLLPESSLRSDYQRMMTEKDTASRHQMQDALRARLVPGSIDVNIMTKVDGQLHRKGVPPSPDETVAVTSLRGYARSKLRSSIVFSAGMNRRLFSSLEQFDDFYPNQFGDIKKKIVLKVSDFRSAWIQGKLLASKGLWVSEFRVESGLNCGGHAFVTNGHVLGPILEEFRRERSGLLAQLYDIFTQAINSRGRVSTVSQPATRFTVQGGIGTFEEDSFLRRQYDLDGTGWGTPFLLVPEVTNVDDEHLEKLIRAGAGDVYLSDSSPLGVPFWNLRSSASEEARHRRIESGKPGSPCPRGYLKSSTEFTPHAICTASQDFQGRKLGAIAGSDVEAHLQSALRQGVLAKACICYELSGGAVTKNRLGSPVSTAICPGPAIADYDRCATLEEMVGHIYGRLSLTANPERPHMFVRELMLYMDFLKGELEKNAQGLIKRTAKYFDEFRENLQAGIEYNRQLADRISVDKRERFLADLNSLYDELKHLLPDSPMAPGLLTPATAAGKQG
jgi:hypothetical protein